MISVDRIYQTLLFFTNSDIRGNVKPRDLRLGLYNTIQGIYEEYFNEVSRATNRENRGYANSGIENPVDKLREKINYFMVEDFAMVYATPYFTLPDNIRYIDSAYYVDYNGDIEICKNVKEFKLISNFADTKPTITRPIGVQIGMQFKVAPSTIITNVFLSYLRQPVLPNWTFNMIGGAEVFDPSKNDFRDVDMHPSEEYNIVLRTLSSFGINLKEADIVNYTAQKSNQEFNQDNAV